ncbi:MAG: flagellar hook-associated protein FlgK [Bacillota bacterium]
MSFLGIEIARRSLHGHQQAMNTTAHNIANINTPGYKRQEAVLQSTLAIAYPSVFSPRPGQLGTGMSAVEIKRYSDAYLDRQVREAQSAIGYWSGVETALQRVEAVLPEPTDFGIQALLGNFFNTWHYLVQDPANPGSRSAVRGAAETLANSLSLAHYSLTNVRNDLIGGNGLFAQQVGRINSIGWQIAELNREIAYQRTAGANPNDLLDRRDYLLEELAKLADVSVTVTNAELNLVGVSVYGLELVNGDGYLATDRGFTELAADHESLQNLIEALEGSTRGGLAGTFAVGARVVDYLDGLATLMSSLADAVNGVFGGGEFFKFEDGVLTLGNEARELLAAVTAEQAWAVAQIREQRVVDADGDGEDDTTLDGYYQQLVTGIGADLNTVQRGRDNVSAILGQIEALRESVSGVNLDEELTRMIQYQYGYQAAARVITMLDELLDTLINRML